MSNPQQEAFNLDAESTLLSIILICPQEVSALQNLDDLHFYGHEHQLIFGAIKKLASNKEDITPIAIMDAIKSWVDENEKQNIDKTLKGLYLTLDASKIINYSVRGLESGIIRDWTIRETKRYAQLLLEATNNNDCNIPEIIKYTEKLNKLKNDLTNQDKDPLIHIQDATKNLLKAYKDINTKPFQLSTYIPVVDHALAGGEEDDEFKQGGVYGITVILGRPGSGKTTFAQHIAKKKKKNGVGCIFFSLELTQTPLTAKFIGSEIGVSAIKIINKRLNSDEFQRLDNSVKNMGEVDLYISTELSMTAQQIKAAVEPYKEKVGLIVIDYAGLMKNTNKNNSPHLGLNENLEVLKSIYDDWGIIVLLICQATRTRPDKAKEPPNVTQIAGSEQISRDASVIMIIHPDELRPGVTLSIPKNRLNSAHPEQNIQIEIDPDTNKITGVTGKSKNYNTADDTDF